MTQVTLNNGSVDSAGSLLLKTNGTTTAVTLDTAQNMGLGVTPSAWSGYGIPVMELPSGGTIVAAGNSQNLGANWYYSGGNFLYKTSNGATYLQQVGGTFKWFTAPSGTAGNAITFTQAMTLDASGRLLVGTTSDISQAGYFGAIQAQGAYPALVLKGTEASAATWQIGENAGALAFWRTSIGQATTIDSSGNLLVGTTSAKQQLTVANLGHFAGRTQVGAAFIGDDATNGNNRGVSFGSGGLFPCNGSGSGSDNSYDLGGPSNRWKVVYAGTGTINTSDANQKTDVDFLDDAEKRVAVAIKSLIKKFRFKDAVNEKGDAARIHVGVMAQDIAAAFVSEGLDPSRYALFCSDTWYEVDGKAMDENVKAYTSEAEGAVSVTRLGIRYDELLAFVIAAI